MSSSTGYFFTVKRWAEIAPAVAALADEKFERRADLASALGIDASTLSNWLSGSRTPLLDSAMRLVEKVGGSWGQLLGEGPSPSLPRETREQADRLARDAADLARRLRDLGVPGGEEVREEPVVWGPRELNHVSPDVDEPQDLHESEMEVVAYAAAGQDRHPEAVATGETVPVINHVYRKAQRGKWKVVKVVGDSMAPEYEPGDLVLVEPARDSSVRSGDVAYVMLNGECLLKVLAFRRDRDSGRFLELKLRSLNPGYPEIQVNDHDWFHVIGVEAYRIQRGRNFK